MATNFDKALYGAPLGMTAEEEAAPPIEIEIENPDSVTIGMGGLEINLTPEEPEEGEFDANLAEEKIGRAHV